MYARNNFHTRQEVDMNANNDIIVGSCVWGMMTRDNKESNENEVREEWENEAGLSGLII